MKMKIVYKYKLPIYKLWYLVRDRRLLDNNFNKKIKMLEKRLCKLLINLLILSFVLENCLA